MKACVKNLFLLPVLLVALGLIPVGRVTAQIFTTLHSFTATSVSYRGTNIDGAYPQASLVLLGNTLYGTASYGGQFGNGTVFAVKTDGTGFTNVHSLTGSDGAAPFAGLVLSGNILYGTCERGGDSIGDGTVFALNTDGTGFTNLHSFNFISEGAAPFAGLVLSGNILYGTASRGGGGTDGTVFAINTDGTGFTNLHTFTKLLLYPPYLTNTDGANPYEGLIISGDTLYGTAAGGGSSGNGTVFAVSTDGTGFTNLHAFTTLDQTYGTNSDGATPTAGLVLSGNTLYGTATYGGSWGYGTVFAVNTDGTGFTNLHSFPGGSDGGRPYARLILSGNILYGTAAYGPVSQGGSSGNGTLFALYTDGTGFTNLHVFTGGNDGANPFAGLTLSGNTLFGTTWSGGSSGSGTIFSFSLPRPQLTITLSDTNVILTWPINYAGFTLQSTTNLVSPSVWSTNSPAPVVVNGQNTITNSISGTQQFFRLSQ